MTMNGLVKIVVQIATLTITVPIWVILILGILYGYDHHRVKTNAVKGYVEQSVLAETEARAKFQAALAEKERQRADKLENANQEFQQNLAAAHDELNEANEALNEIQSHPVNRQCVVDQSVIDKLRNK